MGHKDTYDKHLKKKAQEETPPRFARIRPALHQQRNAQTKSYKPHANHNVKEYGNVENGSQSLHENDESD